MFYVIDSLSESLVGVGGEKERKRERDGWKVSDGGKEGEVLIQVDSKNLKKSLSQNLMKLAPTRSARRSNSRTIFDL